MAHKIITTTSTDYTFYPPQLSSTFTYVGSYDAHIKYNIGDVVSTGDEILAYVGNSWIPMASLNSLDYNEESKQPDRIIQRTKCSCGAPLNITDKDRHTGLCKCAYCGNIISIYKEIK